MQQYQDILIGAFHNYHGIIFSGGTLNGIGRLIGNLMEKMSPDASKSAEAIAYLPRYMPAHAQPDTRHYRHIHTQGQDFSPLEPLQMWIDLLASGINPRQVKLLGIGGGTISAFEYRLAITLGAQVGINVHEAFCQQRMKARRKEPNLQPWEKLSPDFQNSNCQQAAFSVEILLWAGFSIEVASTDEDLTDPGFSKDEIENMAEMEHGRWNVERIRSGWRYGPEKDEAAKISPYLVPWKYLSDEIKEYDREAVCNFPRLLWQAKLRVVRGASSVIN
jgi:hypothetical protein